LISATSEYGTIRHPHEPPGPDQAWHGGPFDWRFSSGLTRGYKWPTVETVPGTAPETARSNGVWPVRPLHAEVGGCNGIRHTLGIPCPLSV